MPPKPTTSIRRSRCASSCASAERAENASATVTASAVIFVNELASFNQKEPVGAAVISWGAQPLCKDTHVCVACAKYAHLLERNVTWRKRKSRLTDLPMRFSYSVFALLVTLLSFLGGCRPPDGQAASPNGQGAPPPPPPAAPPPPPAPAFNGPTADVPAGSRLIMRLDDNVDSGRGTGLRFTASLEAALADGSGNVIVPAGTKVMGIIKDSQSAGRLAGKSELEIAFTDLNINGILFPIQSQGVQAVGEGSGRDTARKVGAAALIGGAFGGGSGAAKGAAIGGAAAMLTRGKEIRIPRGTVLELSLVAPARVPAPAAAAAPTVATAAAPAVAPTSAAGAGAPAAAVPAAAAPAAAPAQSEAEQKACVKKLMANGFSADEALSTCNKK